MKYAALTAIIALVTTLIFPATTAMAGEKGWATTGKILTGVVAGEVIRRALDPNRGYYYRGYYYNPDYVIVDEDYVVDTYKVRYPRRRSRSRRYYRPSWYYRPCWPSSTIVIEEDRIETEIVPIIE